MDDIQPRCIQKIPLVNLQFYPSKIVEYPHSQNNFSHKGIMAKMLMTEINKNV